MEKCFIPKMPVHIVPLKFLSLVVFQQPAVWQTPIPLSQKKMKKRITLGSSGNVMAERLVRYLTEYFESDDIKNIAFLIASACRNADGALHAEVDNDTVVFEGSDNVVSIEGDVLTINATNVSFENDELVLDYN